MNGIDRVGSVLGSDGLRHHRRPPRRDLVDTPVRALDAARFRVKESQKEPEKGLTAEMPAVAERKEQAIW